MYASSAPTQISIGSATADLLLGGALDKRPPVSIENISICQLRQDEADMLLKKAYESSELRGDLKLSFQDEVSQDTISALPQSRRLYFLVYTSSSNELIAGIDSETINLSSFCKTAVKRESLARGRDCLRILIERIVVPKCEEKGQDCFSAMPATERSMKVFKYLGKPENLPVGISIIEYTHPSFLLKLCVD